MCDCNVTENRDLGDDLVKGRITKPLRLETNYSADDHRRGSGIDYVMGERHSDFRIRSFRFYRHMVTDHPGIVADLRAQALSPGDPGRLVRLPVASVTLGLGWPRPVGSRHDQR